MNKQRGEQRVAGRQDSYPVVVQLQDKRSGDEHQRPFYAVPYRLAVVSEMRLQPPVADAADRQQLVLSGVLNTSGTVEALAAHVGLTSRQVPLAGCYDDATAQTPIIEAICRPDQEQPPVGLVQQRLAAAALLAVLGGRVPTSVRDGVVVADSLSPEQCGQLLDRQYRQHITIL